MLNSIEDLARSKAKEMQVSRLPERVIAGRFSSQGKLQVKITGGMAGVGAWLKTWKMVAGPHNYVPNVDMDGLEKIG